MAGARTARPMATHTARRLWQRAGVSGLRARSGERQIARLRRPFDRRSMAIPLVDDERLAASLGRREGSLFGTLVRSLVLAGAVYLLVTYGLPVLLELSAAPYR